MHKQIISLVSRYPQLEIVAEKIQQAYELMVSSYQTGNKLLVCGNGGSASDADHIVGELMKSFCKKRPIDENLCVRLKMIAPDLSTRLIEGLEGALPAINLAQHAALTSAFANDRDPVLGFAQQVNGYGKEGDVFLGITTSGNSQNVILAATIAKAKGLGVISLTGEKPAKIDVYSDVAIKVPETETFKIQELHLPVYHALCLALEETFWKEERS